MKPTKAIKPTKSEYKMFYHLAYKIRKFRLEQRKKLSTKQAK
jgi:hypothetical protein